MTPGAAVWLALGAGTVLLVLAPALGSAGRTRDVPPLRLLAFVLASRLGRAALLGLWAELGFHLLCERP